MMNFNYIIKDEMGIHARPAGLLVKLVKSQDSKVTITKGEKTVDASKIFAVMGLAVKCGEEMITRKTCRSFGKAGKISGQ